MKQKVDLSQLSAEELQAELKKRENQKDKERDIYKQMVASQIKTINKQLMQLSSGLSLAKMQVFYDLKTLLDLKQNIYGVKSTQQSHTFSDDEGNSITYGFRTLDAWDDTVNEGIAKVGHFLNSLAKDEDTARLVGVINNLLKKDAKGNLKANRVLELAKMADEMNDAEFAEGVSIIRKAYKPVRSAFFIDATYTDAQGRKQNIPLSISAVEFPEGTDTNVLFPVDEIYLVKNELQESN